MSPYGSSFAPITVIELLLVDGIATRSVDDATLRAETVSSIGEATRWVAPGGVTHVKASVAAAERAFVSPSDRTTCAAPEPEQLQSPTGYESEYGVGLASGRAAQGGGRTDTRTSAPPACLLAKKLLGLDLFLRARCIVLV
ncbi:hypothetical protein [Streptomyces sp. NPDC054874]